MTLDIATCAEWSLISGIEDCIVDNYVAGLYSCGAIDEFDTGIGLLAEHHCWELQSSGISDEMIHACGIRTVYDSEIRQMLGWRQRDPDGLHWSPDPTATRDDDYYYGWTIPYDDPNDADCHWVVKLDNPRTNAKGNPIKYESPIGSTSRAYFPPGFDSRKTPIVITEGQKKALSAQCHDIDTIGISGVDNWQQRRKHDDSGRAYGERRLIPDLEHIKWARRDVIICYDSDARDKRSVELAQQRLAEHLAKLGANVRVARLPAGPDGGKQGLDDAVVALGIDRVRDIIEAAETPDLPKLSYPDLARMLIQYCYSADGEPAIRYWRQEWYVWADRCYAKTHKDVVEAATYRMLESINWTTTTSVVREILAALKAEVAVADDAEPPCIIALDAPRVTDVVNEVYRNGIVSTDYDTYDGYDGDDPMPHAPWWFVLSARGYGYNPSATCRAWEQFLESSLPDPEARRLLQQWCGYLLSGKTDQHKFMVLAGAPRSGKSTIADTMRHLVGVEAAASSSMTSIVQNFGLWQLVGKSLVTIPDTGERGDCIAAVERLKAIVGEDAVLVDRKYMSPLTVTLKSRVVVVSNHVPRWLDASGALAVRMLLIHFPLSFEGKENRTIPSQVRAELAGVRNWAMRGWLDLQQHGWASPPSAADVRQEAEHAMSPIQGWLDECCDRGPSYTVAIDDLWACWQASCAAMGLAPGSRPKLGSDLRTAVPGIRRSRVRYQGTQAWVYHGLQLNTRGSELAANHRRLQYRRAL